MSTIDVANTGELTLGPEHDEATREKARCTIARRAQDRPDYDQLCAMLGITAVPAKPVAKVRTKAKAGARRCTCGKAAVPGSGECQRHHRTVPVEQVRLVTERIKRDTGMGRKAIAKRIGVGPVSFSTALSPSKAGGNIAYSTYEAVLRLAEELGA